MSSTVKDFDLLTFETHWQTLSVSEKKTLIEQTADLDIEIAIIPVLAGITSHHPPVCDTAKNSLGIIQSGIGSLLEDPLNKEQCLKGMKISASVCSRIYALFHTGMSSDEYGFIFQALLETDGRGAFFAFKALCRGLVSIEDMENIIDQVPDRNRLAFIEQFLQTGPTERLNLGLSFKQILKSITQRETVIKFYAGLFDRRQDADPFFFNISREIRDPDQIIARDIRSQSVEKRIMGLKALSMLTMKLPTQILTDILATDEQAVRITVYQVIENSPLGTYPEMYSKVLPFFNARSRKEALPAFKALVVSGKFPLYTILEMVRRNAPEFMQVIYRETSTLSRLSFFFLQDIALNNKMYKDKNLDINLSCILGMTRKRPERIIQFIERYSRVRGLDNNDVNRFIDKTKQLLVQEKKSIESEFKAAVQMVKKESFKQTAVNCNLAETSFCGTSFTKNCFYNVDMRKTRFDDVNFDNCVFINVKADGAVFTGCSFQNVSVYNCSFNHTDLKDTSFAGSTILKTSFDRADLTGSSFAFSRITALSFETSNIKLADFSNVRARFCKFPIHAELDIISENLDYNARKFQLSYKDMPLLPDDIVAQINMMLFCEFIHYGEKKFIRMNRLSLTAAFDIFKSRQAELFLLIPFLLHENYGKPGTISFNQKTPCGIFNYFPGPESQDVIKKHTDHRTVLFRKSKKPAIEGLFTIGSIGSIAQTSNSDIDYWVCINKDKMTHQDIERLKIKLKLIERLAIDQFNTQVTFFLVDIVKAKNNDFGDSTVESSGSAQAILLKEEFYRTMIHIAGKIPFWAVLPCAISLNYYNPILNYIGYSPNHTRYIDLGDIHFVPRGEYFGASIWQMFKWLKSPFKSVIKMALLEKYITEYGKEALLCNKYKEEWMNSGTFLKPEQNDPYFFLLEHLVHYFETQKDAFSVILLLTCFFLKLGISKDSQIDNTVFGLRKLLLEKCMEQWGWSKGNVYEIGNFKSWQYSEIEYLSDTIKNYMIEKYKTVNKKIDEQTRGQSLISPEDQTLLGRKVYTELSNQPGKIGKNLLVTQNEAYYRHLHLKYTPNSNKNNTWELLNIGTKAENYSEDVFFKAETIEEIGAWLIKNNLYGEDSVIRLVPNPIDVTYNDVQKLFKAMFEFFNPLLTKTIHFRQYLKSEKVAALFVSSNFYAPAHQKKIVEYTMIHLNSWGEMFHESISMDKGLSTTQALKNDIWNRIGLTRMPPADKIFYFSKYRRIR